MLNRGLRAHDFNSFCCVCNPANEKNTRLDNNSPAATAFRMFVMRKQNTVVRGEMCFQCIKSKKKCCRCVFAKPRPNTVQLSNAPQLMHTAAHMETMQIH